MTKTKGLVSGGGKKPFKQKGTGNARQGSSRSILMPGGGTAFGPQPRDYSYSLPKKVKKAALKTALSYLVKEGKFFVVENMASTEGKTIPAALKSAPMTARPFNGVGRDSDNAQLYLFTRPFFESREEAAQPNAKPRGFFRAAINESYVRSA